MKRPSEIAGDIADYFISFCWKDLIFSAELMCLKQVNEPSALPSQQLLTSLPYVVVKILSWIRAQRPIALPCSELNLLVQEVKTPCSAKTYVTRQPDHDQANNTNKAAGWLVRIMNQLEGANAEPGPMEQPCSVGPDGSVNRAHRAGRAREGYIPL